MRTGTLLLLLLALVTSGTGADGAAAQGLSREAKQILRQAEQRVDRRHAECRERKPRVASIAPDLGAGVGFRAALAVLGRAQTAAERDSTALMLGPGNASVIHGGATRHVRLPDGATAVIIVTTGADERVPIEVQLRCLDRERRAAAAIGRAFGPRPRRQALTFLRSRTPVSRDLPAEAISVGLLDGERPVPISFPVTFETFMRKGAMSFRTQGRLIVLVPDGVAAVRLRNTELDATASVTDNVASLPQPEQPPEGTMTWIGADGAVLAEQPL